MTLRYSSKYNANSIRTQETVNGVTTKYFIEGGRVVLEKAGNEERAFWYDGNGNAAAFVIYDAAGMHPYYYFRNGQNDVIGLFDGNGNIVARYSYDSWGNLLSIKDGSGSEKQTTPPLSATKTHCATAAITTIPKQSSTTSKAAITILSGEDS